MSHSKKITYLPSEIQARFKVWSDAGRVMNAQGLLINRDALWANYVDARDGLPPGATLADMKKRDMGVGLIYAPKPCDIVNKKFTRNIYK